MNIYHSWWWLPSIHYNKECPPWETGRMWSRFNIAGLVPAIELKENSPPMGSHLRTLSLLPPCVITRAYRELKFCPLLLVKAPLVKALERECSTLQLNVLRQWYRFPLQKNNWKGCHKFVHCHWGCYHFSVNCHHCNRISDAADCKGSVDEGTVPAELSPWPLPLSVIMVMMIIMWYFTDLGKFFCSPLCTLRSEAVVQIQPPQEKAVVRSPAHSLREENGCLPTELVLEFNSCLSAIFAFTVGSILVTHIFIVTFKT